MDTVYENCPYCHSKKVKERIVGETIVVYCDECGNVIERKPKKDN